MTTAAPTPAKRKTCFSYLRFSDPKQKVGSSEWRQSEIAPRVANEKGWDYDESLNVDDKGLSGFHKLNLAKGAGLGMVKSG